MVYKADRVVIVEIRCALSAKVKIRFFICSFGLETTGMYGIIRMDDYAASNVWSLRSTPDSTPSVSCSPEAPLHSTGALLQPEPRRSSTTLESGSIP